MLLKPRDGRGVVSSISLALEGDCELVIGKPMGRMKRLSEWPGNGRKIAMKSGDPPSSTAEAPLTS